MIEARCMYCGNPMGDLMFDVMARRKGLATEFCDECLEKHYEEITGEKEKNDEQ